MRCITGGDERPVSYRFLFLDGEEAVLKDWSDKDNTYGARHHTRLLAKRPGFDPRDYKFVLLDMVGDADLKLCRDTLYSARWMVDAFFDAARQAGLGEHVDADPARGMKDDHMRFYNVGIESVDLIDFGYGPYNDYWHTLEDTLDKCRRESLDAIGRIVLLGLEQVERRSLASR